MGFEQAWLSYRMIREDSEWRGIGRIYADEDDFIIGNAVRELQKAWSEMTGAALMLCPGSQEAHQAGSIIFRHEQRPPVTGRIQNCITGKEQLMKCSHNTDC